MDERFFTTDDGVTIVYGRWEGPDARPPLVLHHGFTGDTLRDWIETGIVAAINSAGRTVIAPDARGHGRSGKPHRADAYGEGRMAQDLSQLIDAIGVDQVDLLGFSMGAIVALIAATEEARIRRLITIGVGAAVVERGGVDTGAMPRGELADALESETGDPVSNERVQAFLEGLGGRDVDRVALAMVARAVQGPIPLDRIMCPTLVLAGEVDPLAQRPEVLAKAIPGAQLEVIAGDHGTAITNPDFAASVLSFLRD
jgi:pimeloyl-ACP methyl ester carboxylesterase